MRGEPRGRCALKMPRRPAGPPHSPFPRGLGRRAPVGEPGAGGGVGWGPSRYRRSRGKVPPPEGTGAERTSGSGRWVPAGSPPHPARSPSGLSLRLKAAAAAARQREGAGEGRVSEWPAPARQQPARRPPRARVSPCLD